MIHPKFAIFIVILLFSCGDGKKKEQAQKQKNSTEKEPDFVSRIQNAHKAKKYNNQQAVRFNFKLTSANGKTRMEGDFIMKPNMSKVKFKAADSTTVITWKEGMAYLSPDTSSYPKPRFNILTWPYFFVVPYKLRDPGVNIKEMGTMPLKKDTFSTGKLFFDKNVGDAPDDWYIIYQNQESKLIEAMAYIVTYQKETEKASQNPHCITYENHTVVKGIPLPVHWKFWSWSKEKGLGKLLMEAHLENIEFFVPEKNTFKVPEGSRKVPLDKS